LRKWIRITSLLLFVFLLTACDSFQDKKEDVLFSLDQNFFPLKPWNVDNSQITTFSGKIMVNKKPVVNALVKYGQHTLKTNKKGSIQLTIDQSKLKKTFVQIESLDHATVSGKSIKPQTKKALMVIKKEIEVGYPIQVTKISEQAKNPKTVKIEGKLVLNTNSQLPAFTSSQYGIYGTVKDYQGHPIKNARVQITREGGEGWAFSKPSDDHGHYILYYIPDDDDQLNLNIKVRNTVYHLPKNKVYFFPNDTSVETNIQLPKEGETILDKPPYLVSKIAPGALYSGILVGLSIDDKIQYQVTIPQNDGSFSMIVPKDIWDKHPEFYETNGKKFLTDPVSPGTKVTSTFLPKPSPEEPNHIEANGNE